MNMSHIIDLSDTCIRVYSSGQELYAEPGIALLAAGKDAIIGQAAQEALRQQPTRINSRYWSELSTDPLQMNDTSIRHNADLAWNQLSQIKPNLSESVSFCVPSSLNQQQMQLLTGICQSLEIKVSSLVNLGLAQLMNRADEINENLVTHIELQLHQLVVTQYELSNAKLTLGSQETIQDISFLRLIDRLLHLLQNKFIQNSRFDPLHSGDTEQQLFDQLIEMIKTGQQTAFHIETAQKQHKIELSTQELQSVVSVFANDISTRLPNLGLKAYAPVFSQLPGFKPADTDIALRLLDTEKGAVRLLSQQSSSEDIIYINSASLKPAQNNLSAQPEPVSSAEPGTEVKKESAPAAIANALLFNNRVYPENSYASLKQAGFPDGVIAFSGNSLTVDSEQLIINGRVAQKGQVLIAGDLIQPGNGLPDTSAVQIVD